MKRYLERHALELLMVVSLICAMFVIFMEPATETRYIRHTVQTGECIWNVAEQYSDMQVKPLNEFSWMIAKHNGLQGKVIRPGDSLEIPLITYVK